MSKAARRRRFLRWRKYRRQCAELTGQNVPITRGMGGAWIRAMYRVAGGPFCALPHWYMPNVPEGSWHPKWKFDDDD